MVTGFLSSATTSDDVSLLMNRHLSQSFFRSFCFAGMFFVLPCVESYSKVDLRTVSFDVPPQEVGAAAPSAVGANFVGVEY